MEVILSGVWKIGRALPSMDLMQPLLESKPIQRLTFDTLKLAEWDSMLLIFLSDIRDYAALKGIDFIEGGLPDGARGLLSLAHAAPERAEARKPSRKENFLSRIGRLAVDFWRSSGEMMQFLGEAFLALIKLFRGRARFRFSDLVLFMQECGAASLPIVSLIGVLVGLILAFIGAIQLQRFGAQVYVADLVGIAMLRIMGAVMTGVIVAGRIGAAFAAQLGTMQVNEEIDALKTLGISPMEYLVLPRLIALTLMMPLLCVYADLMGILGGLIVGISMLDLNFGGYIQHLRTSVHLTYLWIGLLHAFVFGIIVALAGCLRGMQSGRSASAVGEAATSAVVTSIVGIVVATAIIAVGCQILGI
jgi:phospholipid/cholesterol/gamma-HCH transport system permease protein